MESFRPPIEKPEVEQTEAHTREEAYALMTPEHIQALSDRLSTIERTDNLYDTLDAFSAVLKEFSFEVQLDNGNKVRGIPTTLHESQIPRESYEEWGRSAEEGKVQIVTVKHIVRTLGSYLDASSGRPFNTDEFLSSVIILPVVAQTVKRLFDDRNN